MLLGTLGASLLENMLAGKGVIRAGYKVRKKYVNILRHIQFINDVSDVLHLSSDYNSGLQYFN